MAKDLRLLTFRIGYFSHELIQSDINSPEAKRACQHEFLGFYKDYTICFVLMSSFASDGNGFPSLTLPDNTRSLIAAYWTCIMLTNFIFHF